MNEEYPVQIGFYLKFQDSDEVIYLTEGSIFKIPNSNVIVWLKEGTLWFHTGKPKDLEYFS